jgi:hypothetical protein
MRQMMCVSWSRTARLSGLEISCYIPVRAGDRDSGDPRQSNSRWATGLSMACHKGSPLHLTFWLDFLLGIRVSLVLFVYLVSRLCVSDDDLKFVPREGEVIT